MQCIRNARGEPMGSILYEKPTDVPERCIIDLLPLGAIGVANCIKAVAMVKKTIKEDNLEARMAVIKTVKLFGVTDQKIFEKIWASGALARVQGPMPATAAATVTITVTAAKKQQTVPRAISTPTWTLTPTPTASPIASRVSDGFIYPHLRWMQEDGAEGKGKGEEKKEAKMRPEEREKREEEEREKREEEEEKPEKKSGGESTYIPPHIRVVTEANERREREKMEREEEEKAREEREREEREERGRDERERTKKEEEEKEKNKRGGRDIYIPPHLRAPIIIQKF
ncbi:hypothetical protein H072_6173 [Dactylellina haptotyla CBS 200.50]|uniref:Uncharacterized protein n=1 Tax=Dactylellina haptotyla (strain CBS 200.50) TaxID=1284197 RepID=S8AFW6_DACHA|nr:hypothetical protein H072_6173 [Dactylellina haptotyla CBS 200.50]